MNKIFLVLLLLSSFTYAGDEMDKARKAIEKIQCAAFPIMGYLDGQSDYESRRKLAVCLMHYYWAIDKYVPDPTHRQREENTKAYKDVQKLKSPLFEKAAERYKKSVNYNLVTLSNKLRGIQSFLSMATSPEIANQLYAWNEISIILHAGHINKTALRLHELKEVDFSKEIERNLSFPIKLDTTMGALSIQTDFIRALLNELDKVPSN